MLALAATALLAPVIAPNDPLLVVVPNKLQGASAQYPLGTDQLGRCILSRLIWGGRNSLRYSLMVLLISLLIGVPVGLLSGYVGGRTDAVIMRIIDVFMAMPSFIVALAVAGSFGGSAINLVLAMSFVYWSSYARLTRALTLQMKKHSYIMALKAGGCSNGCIVFKHILRNISPSITALATMELGSILLSIAGFSFISLGVQAPTPEWGIMLSDSREFIQLKPLMMLYPGLAIMISVVGFNLLGEGIQDGMSDGI